MNHCEIISILRKLNDKLQINQMIVMDWKFIDIFLYQSIFFGTISNYI